MAGALEARTHPDWMESGCALASLILRMSLLENRLPLFRDMRYSQPRTRTMTYIASAETTIRPSAQR
jgi:hypothetical protein